MAPAAPAKPLIIGGSRGIGRAAVLELARRGVPTALAYLENKAAAEEVAETAARLGPRPVLLQGDVATDAPTLVDRAADALDGLDFLAVTAVPILLGRLRPVARDDFQQAVDVVVWGFIDAVRAAAPALAATGGSVVAVSSLGSSRAASYYGVLGPAKAALESAARYLALELGPDGIRVNVVAPGLVQTDAPPADAARFFEPVAARTPLRRLATSGEVASVILSLGSSDFSFVTGQTIAIDGGYGLAL